MLKVEKNVVCSNSTFPLILRALSPLSPLFPRQAPFPPHLTKITTKVKSIKSLPKEENTCFILNKPQLPATYFTTFLSTILQAKPNLHLPGKSLFLPDSQEAYRAPETIFCTVYSEAIHRTGAFHKAATHTPLPNAAQAWPQIFLCIKAP